jgi:hypothetical protein
MSYEEEDTCMSYEEEDTCMSYEELRGHECALSSLQNAPSPSFPHPRVALERRPGWHIRAPGRRKMGCEGVGERGVWDILKTRWPQHRYANVLLMC